MKSDIHPYAKRNKRLSNRKWGLFYVENDSSLNIEEDISDTDNNEDMPLSHLDTSERPKNIKSRNLLSAADKGADIFIIRSSAISINMLMATLIKYHPVSKVFPLKERFKVKVKVQLALKYYPQEENNNLAQVNDMPSFYEYLIEKNEKEIEESQDRTSFERKNHIYTLLALVQQMINVDWYMYKELYQEDRMAIISTELEQLKRLKDIKNNLDKVFIGISVNQKKRNLLVDNIPFRLNSTVEKVLDMAIQEVVSDLENEEFKDSPLNAFNWKNGSIDELNKAIAATSPMRKYREQRLFKRKVSDTLLSYIRGEKVFLKKKTTIGAEGNRKKPNWDGAILIFDLMFTTRLIEQYFELKLLLTETSSKRNNEKFDYINRLYVSSSEESFVNFSVDNQ